jgi:hypothetical protein
MTGRTVALLGILLFGGCSGTGQTVGKDTGDGADVERADSAPDLELPDLSAEPDRAGTEDALDLLFPELSDHVEPGCQPGEGCFLDKCSDNEQCLSGWCVEHLGEGVCSQTCQDECPPGWECQQVAGTVPDVVYICVSRHANLCRPCANGADCKSVGGAEDVCVDYGAEGSFCGGTCTVSDDCPWGFSCMEALTVDGISTKQCVADAGVCPCTGKSVALALWTPCEVSSDFGSCSGKRFCTAEGLTDCDASVPTEETCDGSDNDCDGDVDESTCDDGNECTEDACLGDDGCEHQPLNQGECKDGDSCTVGDHCQEGVCIGTPVLCDDKNPCTDDSCDGLGGCVFVDNDADCDDGDPCTVADECNAGSCQGVSVNCSCQDDADCAALEDGDLCNGTLYCDLDSVPYQCRPEPGTEVTCPQPPEGPDAICLEAVCDPQSGACALLPAHEGFACDDDNECTVGDQCQEGKCLPGVPANCKDDNPCTDDSCNPATGCEHLPNTSPCSDGNVCTLGDTCAQGTCEPGTEVLLCNDSNPCTDDTCDPAKGCLGVPNVSGCSDGNACTQNDQCLGGKCTGGPPLLCDDGNLCNGQESCDPATGCKTGAPLSCDDGNPCTADSCNPATGCAHVDSDGACDDGNACTAGDHCQDGKCLPAGLADCDDKNFCTTDSCDPAKGCLHLLNQAPCDDDNVCTTGDHCHLGECISSGSLACNDGNPCTDDSCDAKTGCTHTPASAACDDGNACTTGDQCKNGWCLPGPALDCVDGNPCTDDLCDPDEGCLFVNNQAPCDDGNACTDGDACGNGACQPGVALDCDDSNPCTDDACDPQTGCTHAFNSVPCTDLSACTTNEFCHLGICGGGVAVSCDDENVCTDDSCAPALGCLHDANAADCDDGDACTVDDSCSLGSCQPGDALDCDDGNECTEDSCDPDIGCAHAPVANDTPCLPDGTCQAGECVPNILASCADVKEKVPGAPSGIYELDPDGDGGTAPFQVWCEMSQDEGGWTLVMNINTADGHMSKLGDSIWTTQNESGSFANRWSKDYKSRAAVSVPGSALLLIVRDQGVAEGGAVKGWRSWNLDGQKTFQSFFDVSMGSAYANSTGGCNNGFSGDGRKQTTGVRSAGTPAAYDTFTNQADQIYTNSYYGACGDTQDGFRLSSHYRWANNSNCGLGLQMDGAGDSSYSLEAGALMKKDTYQDPQRYCCGGCGGCQAYPDGTSVSNGTKVSIGTDHYNCHCSVGVSYRYEWYVR